MKPRIRTIVLGILAIRWCSLWCTTNANAAEAGKPLSVSEAVLTGQAKPDELIVRLPHNLRNGGALLTLLMPSAASDSAQPPPVEQIGANLLIVRQKPADGSLEARSRSLETLSNRLKLIAEIQTAPNEPFIPAPLRNVLDRDSIFLYLPQSIINPVASDSRAMAAAAAVALVDWTSTRVEPNLYEYVLATPDDDGFSQQCGLRAIHAEKAWDTINTAPNVCVAIVDSGIAYRHVDLHPYAQPASDEDLDRHGHGTHVAGIVGALEDGTTGVVGVTWKTKITAYGFLDRAGRGELGYALKKLEAAIAADPHVVLLAWGTGAYSQILYDKLKNASKVLFVAAAGNNHQDIEHYPIFPAAFQMDNLISVMATTCGDVKAPFSNFGKNTVDLAAPGEGFTRTTRIYSSVLNQRWGHLAGTSMSAAFVAGAAALVFQDSIQQGNPHTPQQVKCWLNHTATKLLSLKGLTKTDNPQAGRRLDLSEAVKRLHVGTCPR